MNAAAYPALQLWRDEVRRGYGGQRADRSSTWRLDALWRAACWEAAAQEAARDGMMDSWRHAMQRAREVLADAVAARRSVA
jgi:hypothetical protein